MPDSAARKSSGIATPKDLRNRRAIVIGIALGLTVLWVTLFRLLSPLGGQGLIYLGISTLYGVMMFFGFVNLTLYTIGWILWRKEFVQERQSRLEEESKAVSQTKTAILMPIRHEDTSQVCSRLSTTWRSCVAAGLRETCDVWILSDSDDARIVAAEDGIVNTLNAEFGSSEETGPEFRLVRRPTRGKYKAGNIAYFLEKHGEDYEYAVVLDADSVISGDVIRRLVHRMDGSPNTGLIQTVVLPVRSRTPYAQLLEFSTRRTLPLYARGMYWWCEGEGIYWGHNAMFRIKPFMQYCNLPVLPGKEPMGGNILSQDIVEAALLSRGGWRVEWDLRECASFDELPVDFIEYIKRDARWCQGNLQHGWLVFGDRMRMSHRLYFVIGMMAYGFSALVLALIGIGVGLDMCDGVVDLHVGGIVAFLVFLGTLICLPRCLGMQRIRMSSGRVTRKEILAMVLEAGVSIITAPLLFYAHTVCILGILCGKRVTWGAQNRELRDDVCWRRAAQAYWGATVIGAVVVLATWWRLGGVPLLLWPVVWSFLFSIPIVRVLSSVSFGSYIMRKQLLPKYVVRGETTLGIG